MRPLLPPATAAADDPLFGVLLERAAAHSRPGRRSDPHLVALVVEGGGMRGAVSAGMCLVLEAAGLMPAVDRVYGCSSGALSGCFAAAGQASVWATSFEACACRAFIDPLRALRGRPVLDLDFLFNQVIGRRSSLSEAGLAEGPEFCAVAVSASRAELRVLRDFESAADLLAAVRASCSIPVLTGAPPTYRGEAMVDGGLLESIPYATALREGATHVLVLRSRSAGYRARREDRLVEPMLARAHPELVPVLRGCSERYNRDAARLERWAERPARLPLVRQIAVPRGTRLVPRLSTDAGRIADSIRVGAHTMATALYGERATLFWQPFPELLPRKAMLAPSAVVR
jgi:predicted patatin/cPLA2 family phospholipase